MSTYNVEITVYYTGFVRIDAPDLRSAKQKAKELKTDVKFNDIEIIGIGVLDVFKYNAEDPRGCGNTGRQLGPREKRKKNALGEVL
jgi:hypothetical protein